MSHISCNIFPAIDIIGGKCVRLSKGDYDTQVIYNDSPIDMAKHFEAHGAEYLHVVDLDAAKNPKQTNRNIIAKIITQTSLKVQVGGGVRTENDVKELLEFGALRVIIGSTAVNDRVSVTDWIKSYGANKIVVGADVMNNMIATHGWLKVSDEDIFEFIKMYISNGATTFLCTDISKDGMLAGSSKHLYSTLLEKFPGIKLIASGGVHNLEEVNLLKSMKMESIIIGKALYEGKLDILSIFY